MSFANSIETVARWLSVSEDTVRREIRCGKLRALRVRGRLRVLGEDFHNYVLSLQVATPSTRRAAPKGSKKVAKLVSLERARALRETARRLV